MVTDHFIKNRMTKKQDAPKSILLKSDLINPRLCDTLDTRHL